MIVKTGQCLRLINENVDSKEETNIVSICINPLNRLQLNQSFVLLEKLRVVCWRRKWNLKYLGFWRWNFYPCKNQDFSLNVSINCFVFVKNWKNSKTKFIFENIYSKIIWIKVYSLINYQSVRHNNCYENQIWKSFMFAKINLIWSKRRILCLSKHLWNNYLTIKFNLKSNKNIRIDKTKFIVSSKMNVCTNSFKSRIYRFANSIRKNCSLIHFENFEIKIRNWFEKHI